MEETVSRRFAFLCMKCELGCILAPLIQQTFDFLLSCRNSTITAAVDEAAAAAAAALIIIIGLLVQMFLSFTEYGLLDGQYVMESL